MSENQRNDKKTSLAVRNCRMGFHFEATQCMIFEVGVGMGPPDWKMAYLIPLPDCELLIADNALLQSNSAN